MLATMKGYTKEETIGFRKGNAADAKLHTALQLAKAIAENKARVSDDIREAFFNAGYNEAAMIELVGLVTVRSFTNYVYTLTEIPVDFPTAPELN